MKTMSWHPARIVNSSNPETKVFCENGGLERALHGQIPSMIKVLLIPAIALVVSLAMDSTACRAQPLTWIGSQDQALATALSQNKMILLMAGRVGCAECDYMHNIVCESATPPVKALIQEGFVPWYCDMDVSTEWMPYVPDLASFTLPMICLIHPTNAAVYADRSFNIQIAKTFYNRLLSRASFQMTNAHIQSVSVSNGVARIELNQLTFGATNYLERSFDVQQPERWTAMTNFVSLSRTNVLEEAVPAGVSSVFYRIKTDQ
jgi:hypothetical protein